MTRIITEANSMTVAEYKATAKKPRKYRNKPVEWEGMRFDSMKEWKRWLVLKDMEKRGEIEDLKRQVKYTLVVKGQVICHYVADFVYWKCAYIVEDVKSKVTKTLPVYRIKKKLMKAIYGINIVEV